MSKAQDELNKKQGYGQVRGWRHKEEDRRKRAREKQLEKELAAKADKILGKGYFNGCKVEDIQPEVEPVMSITVSTNGATTLCHDNVIDGDYKDIDNK